MKPITIFDLVLVPFPFSDLSSVKRRPCLVLKRFEVRKLASYFVVCMVTSQLEGATFPGDISIKEWSEAGLPKKSLIRISKIVTIEEGMALKRLGKISVHDQTAVRKSWREMFKEI